MLKVAELDDVFEVKATNKITAQRVNDLLCGAFEGGSSYWARCSSDKYVFAGDLSRADFEYPHDIPFANGCAVIIDDVESDPEYSNKRLDWPAMQKGLQIMADKYPAHYRNFIEENDDAETSDVFLQCAVFGELVFG